MAFWPHLHAQAGRDGHARHRRSLDCNLKRRDDGVIWAASPAPRVLQGEPGGRESRVTGDCGGGVHAIQGLGEWPAYKL
jgi:hypothetical protein